MFAWSVKNRFPLLAALFLVSVQIAVSIALSMGAGQDRLWNGAFWQNADDFAVYLGDVEQIRGGAFGMVNFYAPLPQERFWHPLYVIIGLAARVTGITSFAALSISLWLATASAVFLIHAVSRAMTNNERDASMATLVILVTGGFGWMAAVGWTGGRPPWANGVMPDMNSESFFFPALFMGPHIILSIGLLPFFLLRIWQTATSHAASAFRWTGWIAGLALAFIHPYVVPIVGLFMIISWLRNPHVFAWRSIKTYACYGTAVLLGIIPHAIGQFTNWNARRLLVENALPISPAWLWILTFVPWLALIALRFFRRDSLNKKEEWLLLWLSASFMAIALPFKWDIKLAISWHAAAVWLSIPILRIIRDRMKGFWEISIACVIVLSISSVFMLTRQLPYLRGNISAVLPMYVGMVDMEAWQWIKKHTPVTSRVLPPSVFIGIWSGPYMQRSVWIGHGMETPNFEDKKTMLPHIPSMSPADLVSFLDAEKINVILTSDSGMADQYRRSLAGTSWHVGMQLDSVCVLIRE